MSLRTVLRDLVKVVSDEADRNPDFAERLRVVLEVNARRPTKRRQASNESGVSGSRPANRRPAAILDPVSLAAQGEDTLRSELAALNLEQLKDIVADYGMDHDKLAMKWKTPDRVINRIVEVSLSRANKGAAFRQ